jgi:hypothetical protein
MLMRESVYRRYFAWALCLMKRCGNVVVCTDVAFPNLLPAICERR